MSVSSFEVNAAAAMRDYYVEPRLGRIVAWSALGHRLPNYQRSERSVGCFGERESRSCVKARDFCRDPVFRKL